MAFSHKKYQDQAGICAEEHELVDLGVNPITIAVGGGSLKHLILDNTTDTAVNYLKLWFTADVSLDVDVDYPDLVIPMTTNARENPLSFPEGLVFTAGVTPGLQVIATLTKDSGTTQVAPAAAVDIIIGFDPD